MLSCAFFGHRNYDYRPYEDRIREVIVDLINRGVTEFYNGYRGRFDGTCARIVSELRKQYPQIKNILVLSYYNSTEEFKIPEYFDESVYLLTNGAPPKYAISRTNRELVKSVDYIVSGVVWKWGGAFTACDYAKKLLRSMVNVVTGNSQFFYTGFSPAEAEKMVAEYQERLATDEEFRKAEEESWKQMYEKIAPILEKQAKKRKDKTVKEYHKPSWITVEAAKTTEE